LALSASRYTCQASSVQFILCLLKNIHASSTNSPNPLNHQEMRKGAGLERGTCWPFTSFIHEIKDEHKHQFQKNMWNSLEICIFLLLFLILLHHLRVSLKNYL
jgi:hypothetical protein